MAPPSSEKLNAKSSPIINLRACRVVKLAFSSPNSVDDSATYRVSDRPLFIKANKESTCEFQMSLTSE
jgi:hypothetical protein